MIRLITGNPGSGKTLFVVSELLAAAKLANRPIYTNITDLKIPGVVTLPQDADWTQLPDRSLVVFDECQDIEDSQGVKPYAATGSPGLSRDHRLANLRQHRKREFDLWFIAQHPSFVHHDIRKITDEHVHMLRVMGLNRSTKYTFTGSYCQSPEKPEERRRGDKEFWRYPKKVFGLYHSANGHHFKFKMPRKVAMIAVAMLATCALGLYFLAGRVGLQADAAAVEEAGLSPGLVAASPNPAKVRPPSDGEFAWTDTGLVTPISGCAVLTHSCRCWNLEGKQLALSRAQCLNVATQPLPLSFVASAPASMPVSLPSLPGPSQEFSQGGANPPKPTETPKASFGVTGSRSQVGPPGDRMGHIW